MKELENKDIYNKLEVMNESNKQFNFEDLVLVIEGKRFRGLCVGTA